jgi:hypothetical protein
MIDYPSFNTWLLINSPLEELDNEDALEWGTLEDNYSDNLEDDE